MQTPRWVPRTPAPGDLTPPFGLHEHLFSHAEARAHTVMILVRRGDELLQSQHLGDRAWQIQFEAILIYIASGQSEPVSK